MTTTKTRFNKTFSSKAIASSALIAALLIFGLSGCGHENPLKKASIEALQKAYVQLTVGERACLDIITTHSQQSLYRPSADLDKKCQVVHPAIAKQFSKTLGQTVTVSDLNMPDFWIDFFKKNHERILTLKTR